MNARQRRTVARPLTPIVRAIEGGYFDDVLGPLGTFTSARVFAEKASELLGYSWTFPRGEEAKMLRSAFGRRKLERSRS